MVKSICAVSVAPDTLLIQATLLTRPRSPSWRRRRSGSRGRSDTHLLRSLGRGALPSYRASPPSFVRHFSLRRLPSIYPSIYLGVCRVHCRCMKVCSSVAAFSVQWLQPQRQRAKAELARRNGRTDCEEQTHHGSSTPHSTPLAAECRLSRSPFSLAQLSSLTSTSGMRERGSELERDGWR